MMHRVQTPGQLLREARRRHGVTQARLATRAGTTQSAISRIERDQVSPSIETLGSLIHLLGEDLLIASEPRETGVDLTLNRGRLRLTPSERLDQGVGFADQVIANLPPRRRRVA